MARVRLERTTKRYGDVVAVDALDLEIQEGELLTLLGPSGCGKTTTLRLIAGFLDPTSGRILMDGDDVTRLPPQKRSIGMVFQDYALFPHLSVAENIAFGLRERGAPKATIRARVTELLDLVRLPGTEGRYPAELSGGQQQRIALARAVAHPPRVLLMDEPLGALDLKLREAMQVELRRIQRTLRITTVYVTHDQTEAMNLSDRIAVMNAGRLVQLGGGRDIYDRPRSRFVADFVGKINFLDGRVVGADGTDVVVAATGTTLKVKDAAGGIGAPVTLAVRPEHLFFVPEDGAADGLNVLAGTVETSGFAGNLQNVTVRLESGGSVTVETRPGEVRVAPGDRVRVAWRPDRCTLLKGD